jgi:TonB family protein
MSLYSLLLTLTLQTVGVTGFPAVPSSGLTLPKVVSFKRPPYTDEARRRNIEGTVTVEASFDINGNFRVLRVVKGLGFGLDESALAALKNWRFSPAYRNGQKVSVVTQIHINFSLFDDPVYLRGTKPPEEYRWRNQHENIRETVEQWAG